ncbi:MAG: hypothetical protein H6732_10095 [Alphaproteobacteria bacterium]|nr:hypothetical protein [Alphaproteobacteria bacterium]
MTIVRTAWVLVLAGCAAGAAPAELEGTPIPFPDDPALVAAYNEGVTDHAPVPGVPDWRVAARAEEGWWDGFGHLRARTPEGLDGQAPPEGAPRRPRAEAAIASDRTIGRRADGALVTALGPDRADALLRSAGAMGASACGPTHAPSPDGRLGACVDGLGAHASLVAWPLATPWRMAGGSSSGVPHPDGDLVAVHGDGLVVREVRTGLVAAHLPLGATCEPLAWSGDGEHLLGFCRPPGAFPEAVTWAWRTGEVHREDGRPLRPFHDHPVPWVPELEGWWLFEAEWYFGREQGALGHLVGLDARQRRVPPPATFRALDVGNIGRRHMTWSPDGRAALLAEVRAPVTFDDPRTVRVTRMEVEGDHLVARGSFTTEGVHPWVHALDDERSLLVTHTQQGHLIPAGSTLSVLDGQGRPLWGPEPATTLGEVALGVARATGRCPDVPADLRGPTNAWVASPDGRWALSADERVDLADGVRWRIAYARTVTVPAANAQGDRLFGAVPDLPQPGAPPWHALAWFDASRGRVTWAVESAGAGLAALGSEEDRLFLGPRYGPRRTLTTVDLVDLGARTARRVEATQIVVTGTRAWLQREGALVRIDATGRVDARLEVPAHLGRRRQDDPDERPVHGTPGHAELRNGWVAFAYEAGILAVRADDPGDHRAFSHEEAFGFFRGSPSCGTGYTPPLSGYQRAGRVVVLQPEGAASRPAPSEADLAPLHGSLDRWLRKAHGFEGDSLFRTRKPATATPGSPASGVFHLLPGRGWAHVRPDGSGSGRDADATLLRVDPATGLETWAFPWQEEARRDPPPITWATCPWDR